MLILCQQKDDFQHRMFHFYLRSAGRRRKQVVQSEKNRFKMSELLTKTTVKTYY